MRFAVAVGAVLALTACQASSDAPARASSDSESPVQQASASLDGTVYGEAITLTEVTPVSTILDDPDAWVGRRVLVQGMVVAVCEMKGCWMDIASDRDYEKIQIKVDDGVIVFPLSAKGKSALVEGVVERLDLTADQALEEAKRKAEEHGETFDPSSVTGPQTIYRIRGHGAVIAD
ncbi:MAG: DUF4920 domain-containing protein [Gemmatimonadota bacterium]|jgi:hypothetical protein